MSTDRDVKLTPLRSIAFPDSAWVLNTWTDGTTDSRGCERIHYALYPFVKMKALPAIFTGDDFYGSPLHATDSDDTHRALMNFLTLRPGDTDAEYFDDYTWAQKLFCERNAEELSMESMFILGEDS